jgi:hypothetical protein
MRRGPEVFELWVAYPALRPVRQGAGTLAQVRAVARYFRCWSISPVGVPPSWTRTGRELGLCSDEAPGA